MKYETLWLSVICGSILLLIYIIKCCKKRNISGLFVKSLVSVFYLITAAVAVFTVPENYSYGLFILIGGVFGLMGDVFLDQKYLHLENKDEYLYMGFASFGLGHLFYIYALWKSASLELSDIWLPIATAILIPIVNLILPKLFGQDFGKFKGIATLYAVVLSFTVGSAIMAYMRTGFVGHLLFAVAGVSFLASDLELSAMYFTVTKDKNTPARFIINIVTYYLAQYLIALSPAFIESI